MGFVSPELPDVDHETWRALPRADRLQTMTRHWVDHGFGTPSGVYLLYVAKMAAYVVGAAWVISTTPGLGGLGDVSGWWDEVIVYQKLVVFTLLFEVLGLGCGFGPLTLRFLPPLGSFLYWLRPGTIRLPPWGARVPGTAGTRRTPLDVALYVGVLASAVWVLTRPGDGSATPLGGTVGILDPLTVVPLIVLLGAIGLRDKTIFLAARGEQYWLTLGLFFLPVADMLIGFKIVMLMLWWGAATSKLNHHFPHVVAVMMCNSPLMRITAVRRRMYLHPVDDLRPSSIPRWLAHGGTVVELAVPFFLVFVGQGGPLTWAALIFMVLFHVHITSTVPMGVPLEWNLFFVFSLFYLFGAYGDLTVWDLSSPALLLLVVPAVLIGPVLGNLRPDLVSFLPAMRYYAGNWATSAWLFRGDAEDRLGADLVTSSRLGKDQLAMIYDPAVADLMLQKGMGWRSMHTHGRALNGLVDRALAQLGEDASAFTVRDGEFVAGTSLGWNFGEGHLHNHTLLAAIQDRCGFAPGEVLVVTLESQPIHRQTQAYQIWDAALGLLEEGTVTVADMLTRQPWPTDGADYPVHDVRRVSAPPTTV